MRDMIRLMRNDEPRYDVSPRALDLEVRHLRLVAMVAEHGSLTREAERLNLTQSALSHQLLDIEERLGTQLFHRVAKKMVLTPAGTRIHATAVRVLRDLSQTEEDVRLLSNDRAGAIRFTTECYTCYHWLPPLMKQLQLRHPSIELHIDPDASAAPIPAIVEGRLDFAGIIAAVPLSSKGLMREWKAATLRGARRPSFLEEFISLVADAGTKLSRGQHPRRRAKVS
jgi:DNA-binding transcriptional LysR family regulator